MRSCSTWLISSLTRYSQGSSMAYSYLIVYMYHIFSTHLLANRYLRFFHFLAIKYYSEHELFNTHMSFPLYVYADFGTAGPCNSSDLSFWKPLTFSSIMAASIFSHVEVFYWALHVTPRGNCFSQYLLFWIYFLFKSHNIFWS